MMQLSAHEKDGAVRSAPLMDPSRHISLGMYLVSLTRCGADGVGTTCSRLKTGHALDGCHRTECKSRAVVFAGGARSVQVLRGMANAERVGVIRRDRLARASGICRFLNSLRQSSAARPFCSFWLRRVLDGPPRPPGKNEDRGEYGSDGSAGEEVEDERMDGTEGDVVDDVGVDAEESFCFGV
jgi:hypothetical protein